MKTAVSLIFWTIFGAIAATAAFTGHAFGWIGTVMAVFGIKQALWPSRKGGSMRSFNIDASGCGDCGDSGCGD
jgi:hypothetical protein